MFAIHHVLNVKGNRLQLVDLEVSNALYSPKLTSACAVAKFAISPLGFEHSPGGEKFESEDFKKVKFLRSYFIFDTYLPREVDGRVIEIFFF